MMYQEYNDRRNDIVNAYNNGELNLPDLQYELAKLDRDYESNFPTYAVSDWSKRAEEALAKMKETHRKVKKKREADAKKMAKSSEEIGKVIFVERDCQPGSFNPYKAMYRNRLGKFRNLMGKYKKLMREYNNAISGQDSLIVRLADAQCDVNRYQKSCDELREKLSECAKRANRGLLAASATGLIVGLILGYFAR